MNETFLLCDTPLWDWDLSWNSEHPRLTPCFRYLVLSSGPCLILWILTLLDAAISRCRSSHLLDKGHGPYPWTLIAICKQVLTGLVIACTVSEACYLLYRHSDRRTDSRIEYVSVCTRMLTFVLCLWHQIRQRRDGRLSSHKLAIFWSFFSIAYFFASPVYDTITDDLTEKTDPVLFVMGVVSLSLVASEAILSHFTDPQYDLLYCDSKMDEFLTDHLAPLPRLLFSWMNRLMRRGYKHIICIEDLDSLRPDMKTTDVCTQFLSKWNKEKETYAGQATKWSCWSGPSLFLALARAMWPFMLAAVCLELLYDFASLVPPIVLDWLITYMSSDEPGWHGYVYALLLFGTAAISNLIMVHNLNYLIRASVIPRSGLNAAIYRKMFLLSLASRRGYSLGELCNLVLVDVQRMFEFVWSINTIWSYPLRIVLCITLLWRYLGVACLAGMAVLVILTPLTTFLAVHTHRVQKTQMEWKDSRLRTMNEILNGIKVLKLFAWEPPFMQRVADVREHETKALRKLAFLNGVIIFLWILAPFLVALTSFVVFVMIDEKNVLDPSIAFVSLALFAKLRAAVSAIPQLINEVVQSRISIQRLVDFLLCEELDTSTKMEPPSPGNVLELERASFSWGSGIPFLQDLTLTVRQGDLIAVVGRVGSGKSALLAAIMGEMTRTKGHIRRDKTASLAYVQQSAWIQNTSLRQNVLFVSTMDTRRYDDVLKRCCMVPDLKILPGGDLTEIGEKGVNLSGGQKQRVNLARAVYHDADFYLLDDPLSAVDAHVSQCLFEDVIGHKGILGQKTRILVTHDLSVLPQCDAVILMSDGHILESGSYEDLLGRDSELTRLVNEFQMSQKQEVQDDLPATPSPDPSSLTTEELKAQMRRIGLSRSVSRSISSVEPDELKKQQKTTLIDSEKMEVGGVRAGVYWSYFRNAGFGITFTMMAAFAAHQSFEIGSNVWLSGWSGDNPLPDGSQDIPLRNIRMGVYGILGFAQGVCVLIGTVMLALAATRASVRLHRSMLRSVLRSPLAFFDTTPIGRILNRFGKDIHTVDVAIPSAINSVVTVLASGVGTLIVICTTHPIFLLIMVPIVIFYIFVQLFYMATSRQLRRLQSVTLSPVLSFFSESIQGTSTIRAFAIQTAFTRRYDSLIDTNCRVFLTNTQTNRWLGVRLQLLGALIVLMVALLSVVQRRLYSAALVGLTLSYALSVTDILAQMVRLMTQLETRMVSVERIDEYSKLEEEAPWTMDHSNLSLSDWPRGGSIVFKDYQMRYRMTSNAVLKGLNLEIPWGQKVGVVGRTGAGKSSLAQALFRVVEPCEGALFIDGLDVALLGLHDLRSKITVIPQDPVLFGGELRLNLDPSGQYSDEEVRCALRLARMEPPAGGLGLQLEEGGENLSVGQRQQVCLARALLKRTKILVLDEATAAVDLETDRLIQETIRSEFRDCTVITVAHRLHTVLDYDRILVMDNGRVAEDGPPDALLRKTKSMFRELARAAGLL